MAKVRYPRVSKSPVKRDEDGRAVTKYRAEYAERVYPMALLGMTYVQIGAALGGVKGDTIAQWAKHHPAFADALRRGTVDAGGTMAISLFNRGKGGQTVTTEHQVVTKRGKRVVSRTVTELPADPRAAETFLKAKLPAVWGSPGGGGSQVNVQVNNNLTLGNIEDQCTCHAAPGESWDSFQERRAKKTDNVTNKIVAKLLAMSERHIDHTTWKVEDVSQALAPINLPDSLRDALLDMVRAHRTEREKGTPLHHSIPDAPYHAPQDAEFAEVTPQRGKSLIPLNR